MTLTTLTCLVRRIACVVAIGLTLTIGATATTAEFSASTRRAKPERIRTECTSTSTHPKLFAVLPDEHFRDSLCGSCVDLGRHTAVVVGGWNRDDLGLSSRALRSASKHHDGDLWTVSACDDDRTKDRRDKHEERSPDESDDDGDDDGGDDHDDEESGPNAGGSEEGEGEYLEATATFFYSYPPCCPESPTFDPGASDSECTDYEGCRWMGRFATFDDPKPLEWVRRTRIASYFELGMSAHDWESKFEKRRMRLRDPDSGRTMTVTVFDRCDDASCPDHGGCCTENARANGGRLVDLEYHTAREFWGGDPDGARRVLFRWS